MAENQMLHRKVKLWCSNKEECLRTYGHIKTWDVSRVTSMRFLFGRTDQEVLDGDKWNKDFNENISDWDVSKVVDTHCMFFEARSFDQDLSQWDVSGIEFPEGMFLYCSKFRGRGEQWHNTFCWYNTAL